MTSLWAVLNELFLLPVRNSKWNRYGCRSLTRSSERMDILAWMGFTVFLGLPVPNVYCLKLSCFDLRLIQPPEQSKSGQFSSVQSTCPFSTHMETPGGARHRRLSSRPAITLPTEQSNSVHLTVLRSACTHWIRGPTTVARQTMCIMCLKSSLLAI